MGKAMKSCTLVVSIISLVLFGLSQAAAQSTTDSTSSPSLSLAPTGSQTALCPTTVIEVTESQLVNQTERTCGADGGKGPGAIVFGRNNPFGFSWTDPTPTDCSIQSISIMVLPGISCSGSQNGGATTLNGNQLPTNYNFPFDTFGRGSCTCKPVAPPQVFSVPPSSYCQGCSNTFSVNSTSGTNGLAVLDQAIATSVPGVYAAIVINQWVSPGGMATPRTGFGYVATQRGNVLAAGGVSSNGRVVSTGDEFNTTSKTWGPTSNALSVPVALNQIAKLSSNDDLPDSTGSYFLISAGGVDQSNSTRVEADLFNTSSRSWSPAPPMADSRALFQLTALLEGTNSAIATGGVQGSNGSWVVLPTAELFDQDQNAWVRRSNMSTARFRHAAAKANVVEVLVTGGQSSDGSALSSAELMDTNDDDGGWTPAGSMAQARFDHTATRLDNGSILVTGGAVVGDNGAEVALRSCELWTNGTWSSAGNLTFARAGHRAVLLTDGTLMVAGGRSGGIPVASAELWNPQRGSWVPVGQLPTSALQFGLVPLKNGQAFAFGGASGIDQGLRNGTTASAIFAQAFSLAVPSNPAPAPSPVSSAISPAISPAGSSAAKQGSAPAPYETPPSIPELLVTVSGGDGVSIGVIIGIVVGVVVVTTIAVLLVVFLIRRRRKSRQAGLAPDPKLSGSHGAPGSYPSGLSGSQGHGARDLQTPGFFGRVAGLFGRKAHADRGITELEGTSIELQKSQPSPFETDTTSDHSGVKAAWAPPGGVMLPGAMASPFADLANGNGAVQHAGQGLLSPATSGVSWDPATAASEASDRVDASKPNSGAFRSSKSAGGGVSVIHTVESRRSDLSRVSITIHNELSHTEWRVERQSLQLGKRLGKGGFGEVFEGTHHGSEVAIKVLEIDDEKTMMDACQEFGFLHGLRHTKLVISYGACVDGNKMLLVMERMEEDLFHAIASDQTMAGDSVLWYFRGWRIAQDIASALVFLHSKGLVHLDVKSLNILLKGRRSEAKLGDLGLARMVPDGQLSLQNTLPSTPAYSAPEVIQAQLQWRLRTQGRKDLFKTEVGTPADIFSFGVVLFEICTGCHPARWRQEFTGELRPEQGPPAVAKLIDDCLNDDPLLRPTAAQVLKILRDNKPPNARE